MCSTGFCSNRPEPPWHCILGYGTKGGSAGLSRGTPSPGHAATAPLPPPLPTPLLRGGCVPAGGRGRPPWDRGAPPLNRLSSLLAQQAPAGRSFSSWPGDRRAPLRSGGAKTGCRGLHGGTGLLAGAGGSSVGACMAPSSWTCPNFLSP